MHACFYIVLALQKYQHLITAVINFCNFIYNYTVIIGYTIYTFNCSSSICFSVDLNVNFFTVINPSSLIIIIISFIYKAPFPSLSSRSFLMFPWIKTSKWHCCTHIHKTKHTQSTYTDKFLPENIALITSQLFIFSFSLQRFPQKLSKWQKSRWQSSPLRRDGRSGGGGLCSVETRRREVGLSCSGGF